MRRNREEKKVTQQSIQTTKKDDQFQSLNFQSPIKPQKNNRSSNLQKLAQIQRAREGFNFGNISISGNSWLQGQRNYSVGGISQNKIIQTQIDNFRATQRQNKPFNLVNNLNSSRIQRRTDIDENQLAVNPHNYQVNNRSSTPTIQRVIIKDVEIAQLTEPELKRRKQLELEITQKQSSSPTMDIDSLVKAKMDEHLTSLGGVQKTLGLSLVISAINSNDLKQEEGKEAVRSALATANFGSPVDTTQVNNFINSIIESGVQDAHKSEIELNQLKQKAQLTTKKFYSHVDPTKEITPKQGVISCIAVGKDAIGHTFVYIEYLKDGVTPTSICTDLVYGSDGKTVIINIEDEQNNAIMNGLKDKPFKRSWTVNMSQVDAALKKAKTTQANSSDYIYVRKGSRFFGTFKKQKSVNCARYAHKILEAAGLNPGWKGGYVQTPYRVATGKSLYCEEN